MTDEDARALVQVLSLAENHQIWLATGDDMFMKWLDEQYAAINTVRAFLKRNGVMTLHEMTQRLAERQLRR